MGKIREAFRLILDEPISVGGRVAPTREPAEKAPAVSEMPYIEIGPRKEVEGSPDVMAFPGPRVRPAAPAEPTSPPASPVGFRSIPAVPRLTEAPRSPRFAPELVVFHTPDDPVSVAYADLLASMVQAARDRKRGPSNIHYFLGLRPEIGTTTTVLNLAIAAARQNQRVVVVDANLRKPAVATRVGLEPFPGLTEVLTGALALSDVLRPTLQANLRVVAAGSPTAIWADASVVQELLTQLAQQADLVFVDGPCWDGKAAARSLATACSAAFLVVPGREAESTPVNDLVRTLPGMSIPLAGCVLTA